MAKDDQKISSLNAVELVKLRPEMYWGKENPSISDVSSAMLRQIEFENSNVGHVDRYENWNIVGSKQNWFEPVVENEMEIPELFNDVRSFDDGRSNSLRTEFFLAIYSESLVVWVNHRFLFIKGSVDSEIETYMKNKYKGYTCICYVAGRQVLNTSQQKT